MVPALAKHLVDARQGPVDPFGNRFATKPKASSQGRRAIVREAQKVESLRLAHPALAPVQIREPAKLHEAGLVLVEAETEPGQPLPNVAEVPLRIPLVLEPDNDIVSVTDDDRFAIRDVRAPFLVEPQVEHVMQEHVRQDGGDYCPPAACPYPYLPMTHSL